MRKLFTGVLGLLLLAVFVLPAAGCGSSTPQDQAQAQVANTAKNRVPYIPKNNVEFNNYNRAQQVYDDPSSILWCTAFPQSSTAPIVTVPVAGKLTSSTTTAFNPVKVINNDDSGSGVATPNLSVDGLYHPNPPPYRYGFTPGGQLVDFTDIPTICTTKPLQFQRQSISVKIDGSLNAATSKASDALKQGDKEKAQKILEQAAGQ